MVPEFAPTGLHVRTDYLLMEQGTTAKEWQQIGDCYCNDERW